MRYYMLNKPRGTLSACSDARCKTVMDCFPEEERPGLFPIGRLDKDTEGLLLVTDDGPLFFALAEPRFHVEKTYLFYAEGTLTPEKIGKIEAGMPIFSPEILTAPAKVTLREETTMRAIRDLLTGKDTSVANRRGDLPVAVGTITLTEGKKHEVKRLLRAVGCRVVYLKRLAVAGILLDESLAPGEYRPLTPAELALIRRA